MQNLVSFLELLLLLRLLRSGAACGRAASGLMG